MISPGGTEKFEPLITVFEEVFENMRVKQTLYFDHQATTPIAPKVLEAMMPHLGEQFANPHSMDHQLGWAADAEVKRAKDQVACLVVADQDEIIFTSGATEANNLALLGLCRGMVRGGRKKVLMSAIEHKSVLAVGRVMRDHLGFQVRLIPVGPDGTVDLQWLKDNLDDEVLLVSIMAINNEVGTVQDIASMAKLAGSVGSYFHCDASQAPFHGMGSDCFADVDLISLSGHKMYGPKGIGTLVIRRRLQQNVEPMIYGGGQQSGLRSGTLPTFLCVGMGAAAELMRQPEMENQMSRVRMLRDEFVRRLLAADDRIQLNGPPLEIRHIGNSNLRFDGFNAADLLGRLQPRLAASTGSACTSGIPESSHVLRAIGLSTEQADSSIRFSFGVDTSEVDIEEGVALVLGAMAKCADS